MSSQDHREMKLLFQWSSGLNSFCLLHFLHSFYSISISTKEVECFELLLWLKDIENNESVDTGQNRSKQDSQVKSQFWLAIDAICCDLLVKQINPSYMGVTHFDDCWAVLNHPCGWSLDSTLQRWHGVETIKAGKIICTSLSSIHVHTIMLLWYNIWLSHLFNSLSAFKCQHVVLIFPYSLNTIQSIVVQSLNECSVTKEVKKILAYVVFSPSTKSRTTNSPTS